MKSENGISYIKLLVIFAIVIVIGIILTVYIVELVNEKKFEDVKTNMLVLQTKVKVLKGDSNITGDAEKLKGQKLSDPSIPNEIKDFLNKGIISAEEYDYYYVINQECLNNLGLTDIKLQSGKYFIVNYNNYEVIYTDGYKDGKNNVYYKLSDIQDLTY